MSTEGLSDRQWRTVMAGAVIFLAFALVALVFGVTRPQPAQVNPDFPFNGSQSCGIGSQAGLMLNVQFLDDGTAVWSIVKTPACGVAKS
jgi:hypothetical protein